jgi:2'-5' RNA ligase
MKQHRVFFSINLPKACKETLAGIQEEFRDYGFKRAHHEQLHATVYFVGNLTDEHLIETLRAGEEAIRQISPFALHFDGVYYGPDQKRPRMIWARSTPSEGYRNLQRALRDALRQLPFRTMPGRVEDSAHITLFRFNSMVGQELPQVLPEFNYTVHVSSVELMESKLHRGGPEHFMLQSMPLTG